MVSHQRNSAFLRQFLSRKKKAEPPETPPYLPAGGNVFEFRVERLLHDLVEPVVFALPRKLFPYRGDRRGKNVRDASGKNMV
jgi:hypothetical protein